MGRKKQKELIDDTIQQLTELRKRLYKLKTAEDFHDAYNITQRCQFKLTLLDGEFFEERLKREKVVIMNES